MFEVFTPARAKSAAEDRLSKDVLRARSLVDLTRELIEEKNKAENDFNETMQRQQKEAEKEFAERIARKNILEREVERLEQRRKAAISPLTQREKDIKSKEESLIARELVIVDQEAENEEDSRLLMRRLDDISMQKQMLDEREAKIQRIEHGIEIQRKQTIEGSKYLALQMAVYQQKVDAMQAEFFRREAGLLAKESLYIEREKGFEKREFEVSEEFRLLADRRILLDKGFEELKRKNELISR